MKISTPFKQHTIHLAMACLLMLCISNWATAQSCIGEQGKIDWRLYEDLSGTDIQKLYHSPKFPQSPDYIESLDSLASPPGSYNNFYGSYISGFIKAPETGNYLFNITSDNRSYFYLSQDTLTENTSKRCEVPGFTSNNQHDKYPEQTTDTIVLVEDQYYYFQLYLKEESSGDHLQLYWKTPSNDTTWLVIRGEHVYDDLCDSVFCLSAGTPCNDNDSLTVNDQWDGNCGCLGTPTTPPFSCIGERGSLLALYYDSIVGSDVSDMYAAAKYPQTPDRAEILHEFNGPLADNSYESYGSRLRGYLRAPVTGKYLFNVTGDNEVRFMLSPNETTTEADEIAWNDGFAQDYDHYDKPYQTSDSIDLVAGQFYAIELVHKEDISGDDFFVFWKTPLPRDTNWHVIDGSYLYQYTCETACMPQGFPCDDGDATTFNDAFDDNCNCAGVPCSDPQCTNILGYTPYEPCNEDTGNHSTNPNSSWLSCQPTQSPNPSRGIGHWIQYDFGATYILNHADIWNYNAAGASAKGFNEVVIDYSLDGTDWSELGTFFFAQATGTSDYDGFNMTEFADITARYVLITALSNFDSSGCMGLSEVAFNAFPCPEVGTPCDDGDPSTTGETTQPDCSCGGGIPSTVTTCTFVIAGSDDAEQDPNGAVDLNSSDLELVNDSGGNQTVGMRFIDLNIPQGANITAADIQFTVDETASQNPCTLNIYGQNSDDAATFTNSADNLTNRPLTTATVTWSPPEWTAVGDRGTDQQTVDISTVVQEIVDRPNYDSTSAIAIIISGTGKRVAESFNGSPNGAPELCVSYDLPSFDCPTQQANIGDPCDDGDPNTSGETIQADCSCGGGTTAPVTVCASITESSDDAEQKPSGSVSINSSDLELINDSSGDQTVGVRFIGLNIPQGANITSADIQFTVDETANQNPCNLNIYGQDSDDAATFNNSSDNLTNRPLTTATVTWSPPDWTTVGESGPDQKTVDISALVQEIVDRNGYDSTSAIVIIISGTGKRVAESYNGSSSDAPTLCVTYDLAAFDCPAQQANFGDPCDDGDNCTINDEVQSDCSCSGTFQDSDNDGTCDAEDLCPGGPEPGDPCDDGDNCTINDEIQNDCSCSGTFQDSDNDGTCDAEDLCPGSPEPGDPCDDGDNCTINDEVQSDCSCSGTFQDSDNDGTCDANDLCPSDPEPGTPCDDGDNCTINDEVQSDCSCSGIFQDSDNDGTCDAEDLCPGSPEPGDHCDDGDNCTINDEVQSDCSCSGTFQDSDNDGTCDANDICPGDPEPGTPCDDGDPNTSGETIQADCSCGGTYDCPSIQANIGDSCDDGDNCTINDEVQSDCSCSGTFQDSDNDGTCDANDICPGDPEPGTPCDDGDPNTSGETIQADCSCGGGTAAPVTVCASITEASDDAEQKPSGSVSINSSDLELINDSSGDQTVGVRFTGLNIPQGANITSANIQFTVDETANQNPCNLNIYGQDSDDATTFNNSSDNLTNRPLTTATVTWSPPDWVTVGESGPDQQTVDISAVLQEIVDRPNYDSTSAIAIIISGTGKRVAESYNGSSGDAPTLCVTYDLATYDCPAQQANFGDPCDDDGDACTINDEIQMDCSCNGTFQDSDNDGTCDANDVCPGDPEPGTPCDDGDPNTSGETIQADCSCAAYDCPLLMANIGDPCDDGDPNTSGETIQTDCSCGGGNASVCSQVSADNDDAEQDQNGSVDLASSDLELVNESGGNQTVGIRFMNLNIPQGRQHYLCRHPVHRG